MRAHTRQWHTKKSKHSEWTQWDEAKSVKEHRKGWSMKQGGAYDRQTVHRSYTHKQRCWTRSTWHTHLWHNDLHPAWHTTAHFGDESFKQSSAEANSKQRRENTRPVGKGGSIKDPSPISRKQEALHKMRYSSLKCKKNVCSRGFAPDPNGGAYKLPSPPSLINGAAQGGGRWRRAAFWKSLATGLNTQKWTNWH